MISNVMVPTYKFIPYNDRKGHYVPYNVDEDNSWHQNQYLIGSAYYGKLEQIEAAINRGATEYQEAAIQAARGGKLKVLQYLIHHCSNYASIAEATIEYDRVEIFKWLYHDYYQPEMKNLFDKAATNGALDILEFGFSIPGVIENPNAILKLSVEFIYCVMLAIRYGANDYNAAAYAAAYNGHLQSFQFLFECGITNISECMNVAVENEKWDFLSKVLPLVSSSYQDLIPTIIKFHSNNANRFLEHLLKFNP
jgi:hypothetical protein